MEDYLNAVTDTCDVVDVCGLRANAAHQPFGRETLATLSETVFESRCSQRAQLSFYSSSSLTYHSRRITSRNSWHHCQTPCWIRHEFHVN